MKIAKREENFIIKATHHMERLLQKVYMILKEVKKANGSITLLMVS